MQSPDLYVKGNELMHREAEELLPKYLDQLQWRGTDDETLLDVGCGSGDLTAHLRSKVPSNVRVSGCDIENIMLEYAKKTNPDVNFFQLDLTTRDLPQDLYSSYDHVFSSFCIHWIRNQRQAFQNIYQILKPGGDLFIYYLGYHPFFDVFLNCSKLPKWSYYISDAEKYIPIYQYVNVEDTQKRVHKMLEDVGFNVTVCKVFNRTYVCPNSDSVRKYVTGVHAHYSKIPVNSREEFIDDSLKELYKLKEIQDNNVENTNELVIPYTLIIIVARK